MTIPTMTVTAIMMPNQTGSKPSFITAGIEDGGRQHHECQVIYK